MATLADNEEPRPDPKLDRSRDLSRLTRHAYLAGLAGTFTVLGMGYLASRRGVFEHGWRIGGGDADQNLSMAFVLLVCSAVMFGVELLIRLDVDRGRLLSIAPDLTAGRHSRFILDCVRVWLVELGILAVAFGFYKIASEYGYQQQRGTGYYQPWFAVMGFFWSIYLYGGLPYVLLTRALQHDPRADRKQAAFVVMKAARHLWARLFPPPPAIPDEADDDGAPDDAPRPAAPPSAAEVPPFDRYDRSAMLGLGVKLFFVPLMTVFFADQFSHLVKNYDYMLGPNFTFANMGLHDVHNVSYTIVFSVDVGLAWCGYVVSSRWIKNTLFSVEPTMLGWVVALLSYPPINTNFGRYFSTPSESGFFELPSHRAQMLFAACSILSFTVYTSATVCFGLRFSNLTHRGIITTGPYAIVRHPAYAAKNFSWWCVMLPLPLHQVWSAYQQNRGWEECTRPLLLVLGLMMMSGIYYMRAITEERHLERDAEYRIYAKKVRYRFIPGLF